MKVRNLTLANFRKFRKPVTISEFSDGLNIVVEPNETGKSTLLEALRAAFFVRHSAKSELVRSFCPFGDDVAPRVAVEFEIDQQRWRLEKQFLKAPSVLLEGPEGRLESDAAEERLQDLLGFEKGNNRGSDPETRGVLGLLWVEQATALSVVAPGQLVRESVREALEAEVGVVLGGRRFDLVKARVEEAYAEYRTSRAGKSTGRLATAEAEVEATRSRRDEAAAKLAAYQGALASLEEARARRRLLDRDLADPEIAERLRRLHDDKKAADNSQLRLSSAEARFGETAAAVLNLEQRLQRHRSAIKEVVDLSEALARSELIQSGEEAEFAAALKVLDANLDRLAEARERLGVADKALIEARAYFAEREKQGAVERIRAQHAEIRRLEEVIAQRDETARLHIDAADLKALDALDLKVTEARIAFELGAVAVEIELLSDVALTVDGQAAEPGRRDLVRPTELLVEKAARIVVTPPGATGLAAESELKSAEAALASALAPLGSETVAAARARAERAANAIEEIASLRQQIERFCPGEPVLGLAPGSAALKALLIDLGDVADTAPDGPAVDLAALEAALQSAREEEQTARTRLEAQQAVAHEHDKTLARLGAERADLARGLGQARQTLEAAEQEGDLQAVEASCLALKEELARRSEALEQVRQLAGTFDVARIAQGIANIVREQAQGQQEQIDLASQIGGLESLIDNEGSKGPASLAAEADEQHQAALERQARLAAEADALELLRQTLSDVGGETARTFLEPVTRRVARYVEQVLPGAEPRFNEEMSLTALTRGSTAEASGDLSRGTQEQLAVLTRLAFADLLLDRGGPVSLILDDPLVYSDDGRFELMTNILTTASERMQIILLTCRTKAFRHVAGHRLSLAQV